MTLSNLCLILFLMIQFADAYTTTYGIKNGLKEAYLRQDALAFWKTPAFWISAILMSMVFMLLVDVFYVHPERYDGNLQTQVVTALLLIISMVSSYWLGTSASSQRKTELMSK